MRALPGLADFGQAILHLVVAGWRQRPQRVAQLQVAQHLVEVFQFVFEYRATARLPGAGLQAACHQVAHAVGSHALAAGIVDGRGNAFQLPGNEQGEADGAGGENEKHHQHADDFA